MDITVKNIDIYTVVGTYVYLPTQYTYSLNDARETVTRTRSIKDR